MNDFKKFGQVRKMADATVDMAKINAQALVELTEDQVFAFRIAACDDQVDREYERFALECLRGLAKLYVGRTVITDHNWTSKNQTARIYDAAVEEADGINRLVLYCYMLRNAETEATIAAIEGGILREVSVGCAVAKATCSICGTDKSRRSCQHIRGQEYEGKTCVVELSEPRDAYEVSFVAVPAQREAGVVKKYGGEDNGPETVPPSEDPEVQKALALLELEKNRF